MPDTETTINIPKIPILDEGINKRIIDKIPEGLIPTYLFFGFCLVVLIYFVFVNIDLIKALLIIIILILLTIVMCLGMKYYFKR